MKSSELRHAFFTFFTQRGHTSVPSSSLIPADDPTLLFANAGMNQFKGLFLGTEQRTYTRAVSIQKCIRAGGKHNDLENVGFTDRHLTFFEMMGNFSFGDYFKHEAILFAWEFLTNTIALNPDTLWVSVFEQDNEAYDIWHTHIGIPRQRIIRLGARDNFWQMGDTGPCGPCTEIYVDRGTNYGCAENTCAPGCHCNRFLEIWNLVFMQYNRQSDGIDLPLAKTGVDTGMGLDRLCAVVQNVSSVFETDLFMPIITAIERLSEKRYASSTPDIKAAFRVLADHIRSTTCAIADGCVPAADGRGYVLRKIIRRAALFAQKLSPEPFFPALVDSVISTLGPWYPDLTTRRDVIYTILSQEVEQFSRNLTRGTQVLTNHFTESGPAHTISGTMAFTLYDTYGFPLELTKVIAHEHGVSVDVAGFEKEMDRQRAQSIKKSGTPVLPIPTTMSTTFTGYSELLSKAPVQALITEHNTLTTTVESGTDCWVITTQTPFYVECGGQVSDQGVVQINGYTTPITGLLKQGNAIAFRITAPQQIRCGDFITMQVDQQARAQTTKNHTATHLLQAALMAQFGPSIKQAGSLVTPHYLRFDFSCAVPVTTAQLQSIETIINEQICNNIPVNTRITTLAEAQQAGVTAFFGEKYNPEQVRVVAIPGVSAELCGGTHVRATGDIGLCKITELSSPSAGNKRIVAVTGPTAFRLFQTIASTAKSISLQLRVPEERVYDTVAGQQEHIKQLHTQLRTNRKELITLRMPRWVEQMHTTSSLSYGIVVLEQVPVDELRDAAQQLAAQASGLWCVIGTELAQEKVSCIITVTSGLSTATAMKDLLSMLATVHIKGGVRDTTIHGGAPRMPEGLRSVIEAWIQKHST